MNSSSSSSWEMCKGSGHGGTGNANHQSSIPEDKSTTLCSKNISSAKSKPSVDNPAIIDSDDSERWEDFFGKLLCL